MIKIENTDVVGWEHAIRGMIKPLAGYPGYKISDLGEVIGKNGRPLKGMVDRCGYREIFTSNYPNGGKWLLVHRAVLSTFAPVENMELLDVNHKDGNKLNNSLENLEWCTRSENVRHSYQNGLQKEVTNPHGTYQVLDADDLEYIRKLHYDRFTDQAIAEHLGCSRSTVSKKIREMHIR